MLEVEHCEPNDWQRSKKNVVRLIDPLFIQNLARESRLITKVELHNNVEHILVEGVKDKKGVSSVSFSAMDE
jgi:hypothetical protein